MPVLRVVAFERRPTSAWQDQKSDQRTAFAQASVSTADMPIIAVTTHNQSDAPTVRRRAAVVGLTVRGFTIVERVFELRCG